MGIWFYAAIAAAVLSLAGIVVSGMFLFKAAPDRPEPVRQMPPNGAGMYPYAGAANNAPGRISLIGSTGGSFDREIHEFLTIGRAPDNNIVIPDEMTSNHHARIIRSGHSFFVEDLSSTNGTYINGSRISGRAPVNSGDTVAFAGASFTIRL